MALRIEDYALIGDCGVDEAPASGGVIASVGSARNL